MCRGSPLSPVSRSSRTPQEAIELVRIIKESPGLFFAGFLFYPTEQSWPQTQRFFEEARKGARALGLEPRIVSTGGTPNLTTSASLRSLTASPRAGSVSVWVGTKKRALQVEQRN